jgi:hypothetical protein
VGGAIGAFVRSVGVVLAGCYGRCDHGIRAVAAATAPRCDSKAGAVGVAALSGRLETCAVCFEVGVAVSEAMVVVIGDWSRGRNGCCDQRLEPWAGQSELSKGQSVSVVLAALSGPLACKWRRCVRCVRCVQTVAKDCVQCRGSSRGVWNGATVDSGCMVA